ncbi:MAG: hypothetical protein NTV92_08420 [Candidatus Bipolaricaulota bacterium]|nr:hypothetical protein [Candidatus Bipolaricaulota bacterium]
MSADELDVTLLCGDPASPDERAAYVTLRACAVLSSSSRQAVRCALRIGILYWFSNVGERRGEARAPLEPKRTAFHLGEAIGTGMTWDEAVAAMKRKPIDFSGYLAVLELLEREYARQWDAAFPHTERAPIAPLRGQIQDTEHAREGSPLHRRAAERERSGTGGGDGHVGAV